MTERKKNIILFFVAWTSFAFGFIAFLFFLDSVNIYRAAVFLIFFAVHSVCRRLYGQKLLCKGENYTYIQAKIYYKQCERARKNGGKKEVDEKILRRIGKISKYTAEFSKTELFQLYSTGKSVCGEFTKSRKK